MKKQVRLGLLALLCLWLSTASQAQYRSIFGQTSTEWVFEANNISGVYGQDTLRYLADTTIGTLQYKKVWYRIGDDLLFREDTVLGQVWYRPAQGGVFPFDPDTAERLIFDFSLSVGDTFRVRPLIWPDTFQSLSVHDVFIDSSGRRNLVLGDSYSWGMRGRFRLIEGVGSNHGILFLHQDATIDWGQYLLCYRRDGVEAYVNDYYGTCNVHTGVNATGGLQDAQFKIYPNPNQGLIYIEALSTVLPQAIALYNQLGQKVLEQPYSPQLDLSPLAAGIYYLHLWDQAGLSLGQYHLIKQP